MERPHNYNFHDLLKVQIIILEPGWFDSYLEKTFRYYEVGELEHLDLIIRVGSFIPNLKDCAIIDGKYFVRRNYIFYKSSYKMGWWETEIEGIEKGITQVRIRGNSLGRMVFPGETIYNLIRFKLAMRGYPLLHGSGVGKNGIAYLFSARGGTGKTISSINFVRRGFDYYSDDSVILGDHEIFSFIVPFNLRFTYDVESLLGIKFSPKTKRELFWKRLIHYFTIGKINLFTTLEAKDVFPNAIRDRGNLKEVFLLIQGPCFSIERNILKAHITKQLLINVLFESAELTKCLLAYSFCNPGSPISHFWEEFGKQVDRNLKGVACHQISLPREYTKSIFEELYKEVTRQ